MSAPRLLPRVLLAVLGLWLLLALTVLREDTWRHSVDSAIYLLAAQSLAAGEGYSYLDQPFFVRPPGLSVLLAPLVDTPFRAGSAGDLNLVVQLSYALAVLALLVILRRLHGALWGTTITLLVAVNPLVVDGFNEVLSEFPSMALFFAGAALLMPSPARGGHAPGPDDAAPERARGGRDPDDAAPAAADVPPAALPRDGPAPRDGRRGWPRALAGALLVGASLWFRSIGLLALPAILLAELRRPPGGLTRRAGRGALLAGVALAAILPWMLESGARAEAAPRPSTQLLMFDYGTAMFRTNPSDPSSPRLGLDDWLARVRSNAADAAGTLARVVLGTASGLEGQPRHDVPDAREHVAAAPWIAALVALALLVTAATRRSLIDLYALAYAAIVLLYFTFVDRLLLPLVPLVLSALFHALHVATRRLDARTRAAAPALLAAFLLLTSLRALPETHTPSEKKQQNFRADRQIARWVDEQLPADARLMYEKGPILGLLTGRRVFTYRNLPGPWPQGAERVDYALFGPRRLDLEVEQAVAAAARSSTAFPVRFFGQLMPVVVYHLDGRLPGDDAADTSATGADPGG